MALCPTAAVPALVLYRYEIAGVAYETAQELAPVAVRLDPARCRPGITVSIKFDAADPGSSILACANWNGLR